MWLPEGVTSRPSIKVGLIFSSAGAESALQQNNIESEGCGEDDFGLDDGERDFRFHHVRNHMRSRHCARAVFCCERLSASMARWLRLELYLYTAVDSRLGPGGSRTTASCQS